MTSEAQIAPKSRAGSAIAGAAEMNEDGTSIALYTAAVKVLIKKRCLNYRMNTNKSVELEVRCFFLTIAKRRVRWCSRKSWISCVNPVESNAVKI